MKTVGISVREIRIHAGDEYRVLYLASRRDAVHVLHAFQKKTRQTPSREILLARARYRKLKGE